MFFGLNFERLILCGQLGHFNDAEEDMENKTILILAELLFLQYRMPQHGEYDKKNEKWFCSTWIDKKQWLEIHGYSPIYANFESLEDKFIDSS